MMAQSPDVAVQPVEGPPTVSRRQFVLSQAGLAGLLAIPTRVLAQSAGNVPLESVSASGVSLAGTYSEHLQGVCSNNRDCIYWAMTNRLIKTDAFGFVLKEIAVAHHHGDLCYLDDKLYVAVNLGLFNDPKKRADSWIYVYHAGDLSLLERHRADEVVYGAGGMAFGDGRFIVVGGLPADINENYIYEYDRNLRFVRAITLKTGSTFLGIQTAAYNAGHWWFGCYGSPEMLLKVDRTFSTIERFTYDCSLGILPVNPDVFLVGRGACAKDHACTAQLIPAALDAWIERGILKPI